MENTRYRLELTAAILDLIDRYRRQAGDQDLGSDVERVVIERQWKDLEDDILRDPGAFESQLVRIRV
jgi:hypothetical protein